ncbi:hypothetical protein PG993_003423 [Apiospora rasikravindrae]|uniref:Cytochrome P450 n=1 Tax=Apiospora rasikravindrae TaxID=990691 RepID=A0ABR1U262_9PEZI
MASTWIRIGLIVKDPTLLPELGWQAIVAIVPSVVFAYFIASCFYNLWFHPLANFPGPAVGRASLLFRFWHTSRGKFHVAVTKAHRKYGPIVRVAPNELSFASVESWKAIYGHPLPGKDIAPKGPFYEVFAAGFSSKCVGSERDPKKHSKMRKMLNPAFSQRGLLEQEEIITGVVDKFVRILGEKGGPGSRGLNMTKWYEMNSFDILGEMAFGESFHSLDTGKPHFWADIVLEHLYFITLVDNLRRIGWLATAFGFLIPSALLTRNQNSAYSRQQVQKRLSIQGSRNDFVSLLVEKVRNGEVGREEMTAHVSTMTIAGGETVATTLAGLTYFLAKNPEKLQSLVDEIRGAFKSYDDINATAAQQLPYLQAVLNEGLRMFPPASGGAPRVSPGFELHGYYIPSGTEINVSPWTITHDTKYFSDPWEFTPERWLGLYPTDVKEASRPFLLGPRDCLGRNFAWMELNLVLSKILWSYDLELVSKDVDWLQDSQMLYEFILYDKWNRLSAMGLLSVVQLPSSLQGWGVFGRCSGRSLLRALDSPEAVVPSPEKDTWAMDVILGGNYVKAYPRIHAKYGPVVRVSPDRVHVSDPKFFHEVYSSGSNFAKDPAFFQTSGGISEALPAIVDVEYHRRRRKMVNNLFSVKSMEALSHIVLGVVQNAMRKAQEHLDAGRVLDIQRLYIGITIDTIMKVLCDRSLNLIDAKEEEPPFLATLRTFSESFFLLKHFPVLIWLADCMPTRLAEKLLPGEFEFRRWISDRAAEHQTGIEKAEDGRKTVIDLLLRPEDHGRPLTHQAVEDETYSFAFAGTHTTSHTMSMGTYYLLRHPEKLEKLRRELAPLPRNERGLLTYKQVKELPYLTAVIKESLRLSSPVPGILPRVVPRGGINWAGHHLPEGTSVSTAIRAVHDNPELFPDPEQFIPERWIENDGLDHWLVVFGKGSRACIGLNIAWMESYLVFSNMFTHFNFTLHATDPTTVTWKDCGNAMIKSHVQVTVDSMVE